MGIKDIIGAIHELVGNPTDDETVAEICHIQSWIEELVWYEYNRGYDDGFFERQADKRHDCEDER